MRVLVAPDKFRGTLSADEAARAIAAGWRRRRPGDDVTRVPMADGGEGTLEAIVAALGGEVRAARVSGPLGDPVDAAFGLVDASAGRSGVVELARASGLQLVGAARNRPLRATTRGTGELILAAAREGVAELLVGVGGSASTDGGAGLAAALGVRLTDPDGRPLPDGGAALLRLDRVDLTALAPEVRGVRVVVASDVDNPLTGPRGAARVFAPQKGASPDDVLLLDRALAHYAAVLFRDLGFDVRSTRGAGAAGGAGAGLVAFLGAHVRPGVEVVMDAVDLRGRIARADVVVTGEGRFDASSLLGKVPMGVVAEAGRAGVRAGVLCGEAAIRPDGLLLESLVDRLGARRARDDASAALEELAAAVAEDWARPAEPQRSTDPGG
ncbi:MAG: glycerate kinase [Actinomycetota bacterium]